MSQSASGPESTGHWFEPIADHLGEAYLRYSFTRGTNREVDALIEFADLKSGQRALDVGCGPGRHAIELAERGHEVHGVDISETFIELARADADKRGLESATFAKADARDLQFDEAYDLVYSLCQGAFGLTAGPGRQANGPLELDEPVLAGLARAAKPGGIVIVSAFSAYFQLRFPDDKQGSAGNQDGQDAEGAAGFDAELGVQHEFTEVRSPEGDLRPVELWTTCYTPRELRLLARAVGLDPRAVYGVTPGRYTAQAPRTDCPEFLLVARKP